MAEARNLLEPITDDLSDEVDNSFAHPDNLGDHDQPGVLVNG